MEYAVKVSCYIINELKESNSQSGGETKVVETKVVVIDSKDVKGFIMVLALYGTD